MIMDLNDQTINKCVYVNDKYTIFNNITIQYNTFDMCLKYYDLQMYLNSIIPDLFPKYILNENTTTCNVNDYIFQDRDSEYIYLLKYIIKIYTNNKYDINHVCIKDKKNKNVQICNLIIGNHTNYDYIFINSSYKKYNMPFIKLDILNDCRTLYDVYDQVFLSNNNENIRAYIHVNLL